MTDNGRTSRASLLSFLTPNSSFLIPNSSFLIPNSIMKSRIWLIILAAVIVGISIIFTNHLAASIAKEEHRKMETWAEATRLLLNDEYSDFIFNIIEQNENIPVIIVDDRDRYISSRNFNEPKINVEQYYEKQIKRLKATNPPIEIKLDETTSQYIYYDNSNLLKMLGYFPYIQLSIIALFLMLVIWAISTDKRAEQDKLWAGLSKETAHQLGTPISSLMAWNEILKTKIGENDIIISEINKDIERLKIITERFSKIGSIPELSKQNISKITEQAVNYMLNRTSKKITYSVEDTSTEHICLISTPLFEWVIENLCKNAIDAMEGKEGSIDFELFNQEDTLIIEVTDSGRGIERGKFKSIFEPGYTTKQRGWGLGLSLAKRIIEEYHEGKIFVKSSELGLGTTFRIELPTVEN
ncbi:MAG: HAMP domain-containing sensor histidine kinase [Paludibacteraceae bacterium]|nr:HAMP domain-containing sensor histidine kinase [Paludibacteraceae bacterium]